MVGVERHLLRVGIAPYIQRPMVSWLVRVLKLLFASHGSGSRRDFYIPWDKCVQLRSCDPSKRDGLESPESSRIFSSYINVDEYNELEIFLICRKC